MTRFILALSCIFLINFACTDKQSTKGSKQEETVKSGSPDIPSPLGLSNPASEEGLRNAALNGDLNAVESYLARKVNVNASDPDGRNAIMLAAYNGHSDVIKLLIEKGARINDADFEGRTALMYASTGPFADAVQLLLSNDAEINVADNTEKFTALMFAAAEGHLGVVKLLLANKADPFLKDKDNDDAESFARENGHIEVATLIKSYKK